MVRSKKASRDDSRLNILVILDQSASMEAVKDATISGFNEFLADQKKNGVDTSLTLTLFNTETFRRLTTEPIGTVDPLTEKTYRPDGCTALHDAVYKTVREVEKELPVDERVLCCILTDGEENSSRECSLTEVKSLIEDKEKTGRWTFTYLGANQDAWEVGRKMGIAAGNTATYAATPAGTSAAFNSMSRGARTMGLAGMSNTTSFYNSGSDRTVIDGSSSIVPPTSIPVQKNKTNPTWKRSRTQSR